LVRAGEQLGISIPAAVTKQGNVASDRVLQKPGFVSQGLIEVPDSTQASRYFILRLTSPALRT
jgi:hypothetical protein